MRFLTVDFLCYSEKAKLKNKKQKKDFLEVYRIIIHSFIQALQDFYLDKNYAAFDAHVGDNSCQIRAIYLMDLIQHAKKDQFAIDKTKAKLNKLYMLENWASQKILYYNDAKNQEANQLFSIKEFFKKNNQKDIYIGEKEIFLATCWFLTKYKIIEEWNTYINLDKIVDIEHVSKTTARKIVDHYQRMLANISVKFLLKISNKFNENFSITPFCLFDEIKRRVLPCYLQILIIGMYLKERRINILYIAHYQDNTIQTYLFNFDPKQNKYIFCPNPTLNELKKPAFIVAGETAWVSAEENSLAEQIEMIDAFTILKINAASHKQYACKTLSVQNESLLFLDYANHLMPKIGDNFTNQRDKILKFGCNLENKSLFLIKHIFCDRVSNHFISSNAIINNSINKNMPLSIKNK